MSDAFILGGVRTPFGRYGGSLSHFRTDDLLGQTMVAACSEDWCRTRADRGHHRRMRQHCARGHGRHRPMGCLGGRIPRLGTRCDPQSLLCLFPHRRHKHRSCHPQRRTRHRAGRRCGVHVPVRLGPNERGPPFSPRGPILLLDTMWAGAGGPPNPVLLARNAYVEMIKTAQNVADRYELTREEIDAFALRSHLRAAAARDSGRLALEIHPVEIPGTRKEPGRVFDHDEGIRGDTSAEQLAELAPQPNTTQMTAGNSSALTDGASAILLSSERAAQDLGIVPAARVVASATHALDPQFMGIAPAFAIAKALQRAQLSPADVDVWEVHEAFAAQALGVLRELPSQLDGFEVPDDRLNPNGGAVAIGHPFGASGTRYVLTLATELRLRRARYGVLGVCVGSGQGVALVIEGVDIDDQATNQDPNP